MEKKPTSHILKGIIISLILIVLSTVGQFLGPQQAKTAGYIGYVILLAGIIWACISYSNQMDHHVTFGNIFAHGFKTSTVVTVLMVVFLFIFIMIFPEMKTKAIDAARQEMESQNMPDSQVDTMLGFMEKSFMVFLIGGTIFFYLLIGVIASLIGAGVAKKNPPTPFGNQA
jgi:hypothetical protein